jgi:hypothetical protein
MIVILFVFPFAGLHWVMYSLKSLARCQAHFGEKNIMSKKQMVAFRLDKAVVELLKKLAEETGKSQAALVREMILKEVYK